MYNRAPSHTRYLRPFTLRGGSGSSRYKIVVAAILILARPRWPGTKRHERPSSRYRQRRPGGILTGVTVTLRNADPVRPAASSTEADGRYRWARCLRAGKARAELQGFGTVEVTDLTARSARGSAERSRCSCRAYRSRGRSPASRPSSRRRGRGGGHHHAGAEQSSPLAHVRRGSALLMPGTDTRSACERAKPIPISRGRVHERLSALLVAGSGTRKATPGSTQDFPQAAIREFKVFVSQSPTEYRWTRAAR